MVRNPDENAQHPTYEPLGLASDELFAIPAHPHGAGLRQSSMALEKIRGVPSRERARTTSNPNLSVRAGPRRRAVSSAELLSVAVCAQGLTKTACRPARTANSHQTDSKRTMRRPARAKPVDRPTRDPVLTRRLFQPAHRSQISRLWLACRKMGGHTLSDFSRSQACAKLIATATNVNDSNQNQAGRSASRYTIGVIA